MARISKIIKMSDDSQRDSGKAFLLTEMSPRQGHDWVVDAIAAMVNAGVKFPDNAKQMGFAALASATLSDITNGIDPKQVKQLLAELMGCVQYIPTPSDASIYRGLVESDIEETLTFFKLEQEVLLMHLNFLPPAQ